MDNLETFVALAEKYKVKPNDVALKYGEFLNKIFDNFPNMSADWYCYEAKRRTNRYFKELMKGDLHGRTE